MKGKLVETKCRNSNMIKLGFENRMKPVILKHIDEETLSNSNEHELSHSIILTIFKQSLGENENVSLYFLKNKMQLHAASSSFNKYNGTLAAIYAHHRTHETSDELYRILKSCFAAHIVNKIKDKEKYNHYCLKLFSCNLSRFLLLLDFL